MRVKRKFATKEVDVFVFDKMNKECEMWKSMINKLYCSPFSDNVILKPLHSVQWAGSKLIKNFKSTHLDGEYVVKQYLHEQISF